MTNYQPNRTYTGEDATDLTFRPLPPLGTPKTGTCPACSGTTRKPVPEDTRKYLKYNERWGHWNIAGYDPDTDSLPCTNCGGQTMSMRPTGTVNLRPDGTPCMHEYTGVRRGRCYTIYTCSHCGDTYDIDSGD